MHDYSIADLSKQAPVPGILEALASQYFYIERIGTPASVFSGYPGCGR